MSLVMRLNDSSSSKGICQPPCLKPPSVSSSGPPGACMTPSRVTNSLTMSWPMNVTAHLEAIPSKGFWRPRLSGRKDQQNGILDHRHTDVCDFLYGLEVFVRSDYFVGTVCNSDPGY